MFLTCASSTLWVVEKIPCQARDSQPAVHASQIFKHFFFAASLRHAERAPRSRAQKTANFILVMPSDIRCDATQVDAATSKPRWAPRNGVSDENGVTDDLLDGRGGRASARPSNAESARAD